MDFTIEESVKFISLVKENPGLYNPLDKSHVYSIRRGIWEAIAQQFKKTDVACKKHWAHLKLLYYRCKKKIETGKLKKGDEDSMLLYNMMKFIDSQPHLRRAKAIRYCSKDLSNAEEKSLNMDNSNDTIIDTPVEDKQHVENEDTKLNYMKADLITGQGIYANIENSSDSVTVKEPLQDKEFVESKDCVKDKDVSDDTLLNNIKIENNVNNFNAIETDNVVFKIEVEIEPEVETADKQIVEENVRVSEAFKGQNPGNSVTQSTNAEDDLSSYPIIAKRRRLNEQIQKSPDSSQDNRIENINSSIPAEIPRINPAVNISRDNVITDIFMLYMEEILKTLPPLLRAQAKQDLMRILGKYEKQAQLCKAPNRCTLQNEESEEMILPDSATDSVPKNVSDKW